MKKRQAFIGANVPKSMKATLEKIARSKHKTLTDVITLGLREFIERNKNGKDNGTCDGVVDTATPGN